MPSKLQKRRSYNKKYYEHHKTKLSLQAREHYAANMAVKKCASQQYYKCHKKQTLAYHSKCYEANREDKKTYSKDYYKSHKQERKAYLGKYYDSNMDKLKAYFCEYYDSHRDQMKAYFSEYYGAHKHDMKVSFSEYYDAHKDDMKGYFSEYYDAHKDDMKVYFSEYYDAHRDDMKVSFSEYYDAHKDEIKVSINKYYDAHKDELKACFAKYYNAHKEERKCSFRNYYVAHKEAVLNARSLYYGKYRDKAILASRAWNVRNAKSAVRRARKSYYNKNKPQYCAGMRQRYHLAQPKLYMQHHYYTQLCKHVLANKKILAMLQKVFKEKYKTVASEMTRATSKRAVALIAAKRLVNKVMSLRKHYAGLLLRSIRSITKMVITDKNDFGEGLHCAHSEPFFYESAYQFVNRPDSMTMDEFGTYRPECELSEQIGDSIPQSWKCSNKCKALTDRELGIILDFKCGFDADMPEVRKLLDTCDEDCPNTHYQKVFYPYDDGTSSEKVDYCIVPYKGHSLLCFTGDDCSSKLRILRAASTHYAVLRSFLRAVYVAIQNHKRVAHLDAALHNGDFTYLLKACKIDSYESLFSNEIQSTHQLCVHELNSPLRKPNLEYELQTTHARIMTLYDQAVHDYYEHPCCSCYVLYKRKSVSVVNFEDTCGTVVWPALKQFMLCEDSTAASKSFFMCHYCKQAMRKDKMPPRCVLNGLKVVEVPNELAKLDCLSKQFIQRAKAYQTVVRLGTYTNKVPMYNSLKACKGNMFFLPLPMHKTMETLGDLEESHVTLSNPELYIIVNCKPTKDKVVWRNLVNVNDIKVALRTLKQSNWLYKNVEDTSIDDLSKEVIEVVSKASSTMLEKATDDDVSGFQYYTVRNLDNKLSTLSDIEQYKLLSIKEDPLDNRQRHLDVMCFPVLFPDGNFGRYHPREVKVSDSEYVKSRLLNKYSRFRKDPQFIFFLLWQKEMKEIACGVYNLLKTSKSMPMSVTDLFQKLEMNDERLEANLNTMFQSVRGTKQYWFLRRSELQCMIRDAGPPTLFLTFSCAEYESPDIIDYLKVVNDDCCASNPGKLCTEDPVSVSRQFSSKFHSFFNIILLKGEVLGTVEHFYWKKEYQARGAPHYHVLLWIQDAPVIGNDDPGKVLAWIEQRITCHIPDKENNPELHSLVTRYQLHKCSNYCKRKYKRGKTFISTCKFGFPREASENPKVHCVEEKLKKRQKIYQLSRTEAEVRVNDYNPLLLLLWKANMDIQFVSESSLALAHYVSGYVTKAERSNMSEIWQEISNSKTIYGRLWSFGLRMLRSRECGLYEASDLLLGDHLFEKSDAVQWIDVSMPHKRNRRLKDHSELLQMKSTDPDSENIFKENLYSNYYPGRPDCLNDVCLHDFVANFDWYGKDSKGQRKYCKRGKPRLVNHKIFDPEKDDQREDYFYSLILLFVPFKDEASLLRDNETAEEAFQRLLPDSDHCQNYHSRLQIMLKAKVNLKAISEARRTDGLQEAVVEKDNDPELPGEAKSAMNDMCEMNVNAKSNNLTLQERLAMLNADQKKIFDKVSKHLLHQKEHEDEKCKCDVKPLQIFISGVGGTGKSFLIEAVKAFVDSLWPSHDCKCAITAPTGLAAFNVGGVTIHRLFQLPIEHEGREAGYWSLPKAAQKVMKTALRSLKMLIIDEVSMVSSLNLAYIHMRLEELFGANDWFGGRNVLFVGDLLQLQPVNGSPIFEMISKKSLCLKLGCATSINIWKDCVEYDELTINERQKKDLQYSNLLDCVRCGHLSEEHITLLQTRVIDVTISEKIVQLQNLKLNPVCLFPTRKQCDDVNQKMLNSLDTEKHVICAIDEVDETKSTAKWHEKAAKKLEQLNHDCNNTAGLEAVLTLAVGARVMLRRNVDVKLGLVNGAIGTVVTISQTNIVVKFDHLTDTCDIQQVRGKFIVMKNYYVYRTQFPLILAYAVTIHKCQGLSLDCAIVDLSDKVFADGMAYVALSRLKSLAGLHLIAFIPQSVKVNVKCLKEVNRLRQKYRADLPLHDVSVSSAATKRKLRALSDIEEPLPKRQRTTKNEGIIVRTTRHVPPTQIQSAHITGHQITSFKYHSVDEQWQHQACIFLGLNFHTSNAMEKGSVCTPLLCPNKVKPIQGDGNCMFRALSYVITGSEKLHLQVRAIILAHMESIGDLILGHIKGRSTATCNCSSVNEYIKLTKMNRPHVWGTDIELLVMSHLLKTCIYFYMTREQKWFVYTPTTLDKALTIDLTARSIYLRHLPFHYDVVLSVAAPLPSHSQTVQTDSSQCTSLKCSSSDTNNIIPAKQAHTEGQQQAEGRFVWSSLIFHAVDEHWQRLACSLLSIPFVCFNRTHQGSATMLLTRPHNMQKIRGDGNCLFRSFSYLITGNERNYHSVRMAIVAHMRNIQPFIISNGYTSVEQYLLESGMNRTSVWGTEIEILTLAHLLHTPVLVYATGSNDWVRYSPTMITGDTNDNVAQKSMYIRHSNSHFDVVLSIQ